MLPPTLTPDQDEEKTPQASSTLASSSAVQQAHKKEGVVKDSQSAVSHAPSDVHELEASQEILQFIGRFEGFRAHMYKVRGIGRWTIGYGHEIDAEEIARYEGGITIEQAGELLQKDVQETIRKIRRYVTIPLTQYQFDALVSYIYNVGRIHGTKLLTQLNAGDFEAAAREMDIVTQNKVVLRGLVRRRTQEQKLFLKGDYGN